MKKSYFTILAALAVLSAGCGKISPDVNSDPDAWIYDLNLPVPVRFASVRGSIVQTKAGAITSLDDQYIKVLGLEKAASWTSESAFLDEAAESEEGKLSFLDGPKYYPVSSARNYDFYAVTYPKDVSSAPKILPSADNTYYTTDLTIGKNDWTWAKAEAEDLFLEGKTISGFNARYMRTLHDPALGMAAEEQEQKYPLLNFGHITTALHFYAKAKDDYAAGTYVTSGMKISKIEIDGDSWNGGTLIIASNNPDYPEGTLIKKEGTSYKSSIPRTLNYSNGIVPTTSDSPEISTGFFLIPGHYSNLYVNVTIEDASKNKQVIRLDIPEDDFNAGEMRKYDIIFHSVEEIFINTSLEEWTYPTVDPLDSEEAE